MSKTVVIDSASDINYLANVLGDAISGRYGAIDKVEITVLDFGTGGIQFATNGAISNPVGRTLVADSGPVPDQTNGPGGYVVADELVSDGPAGRQDYKTP